ncbi:MAG: hypothetical protein RI897_1660 [Verrucomicrobiota bacterium]|jgi:putative NADPH-quinone reductase
MNVLVILAHPKANSLNHALAQRVAETVTEAGHSVTFHDLYAESFDPVMTAAELERDATLPPHIEQHCHEVETADRIAIIHPNWWSSPPAILRGWCDRCLRAGRAYNFIPDGQGGAKPVGLLKAKAALVIHTANTPQHIEETHLGDPLASHWLKVVFGLCGIPTVHRLALSPVITSTPEQRQQWLEDTRQITHTLLS